MLLRRGEVELNVTDDQLTDHGCLDVFGGGDPMLAVIPVAPAIITV